MWLTYIHVNKVIPLKLDEIIILFKYTWLCWQFPDLRMQPGSLWGRYMCHYSCLKIFSIMYVSHAKNVCKSKNTMRPLFLCYTSTNNEFWLVPPEVLVIIDKPANFQDFFNSFLKWITPFKWCLDVQNGMNVSHKTGLLVTKK